MSNQLHPAPVAETTIGSPLQPPTSVFDALAHARRRVLLSILVERQGPITEHELAAQIAACEQETPPGDETNEKHEQIQLSLSHCHLPKLEDVGLIEYDRDEGAVVTDTSVDFEPIGLLDVEAGHAKARSEAVDTYFAALAHDRRWDILSVLKNRYESQPSQRSSLTVEELTKAVRDRDGDRSSSEFADDDETRIALSLQHQHLPKLADAGLITYDRNRATITYEGYIALRNGYSLLNGGGVPK